MDGDAASAKSSGASTGEVVDADEGHHHVIFADEITADDEKFSPLPKEAEDFVEGILHNREEVRRLLRLLVHILLYNVQYTESKIIHT